VTLPEPAEPDVPVLTQVVDAPPGAAAPPLDLAALEALALELERALLERLGPEMDRVTARALERVRADLTVGILQMVREAVAASVSRELAPPRRD
jgi:hypothetical protein